MNATITTDRPHVRIGFAGFWDDFDPRDNFLTRIIARRYDLSICDRPDFLIHSCIGRKRHDHLAHDCVRIFYTGENVAADWLSTDWAFTFEHDPHPRHFRLPHWPFRVDPPDLVKPADFDPDRVLAEQTRAKGDQLLFLMTAEALEKRADKPSATLPDTHYDQNVGNIAPWGHRPVDVII